MGYVKDQRHWGPGKITEKTKEYHKDTHITFIDFKAVSDSIYREKKPI